MRFLKFLIMLATLTVSDSSQHLEQLPILKKSPDLIWMVPSQPLTLSCSTLVFNPIVTYTWEKNGNTLNVQSNPNITTTRNNGTIVFPKPSEADVGEYRCFAEWNLMVASSGIIVVKKAYLKTLTNKTQRHRVIENEPYKLDCPVDAVPPPAFEWKLMNSSVLQDVRSDHVVTPNGSLWLLNVTKHNSGIDYKYICLVSSSVIRVREVAAEHYIDEMEENKNSSSRSLRKLYTSTDLVVQTGDVTKLYCIFNGSPAPEISWLKNGKRLTNSSNRITVDNRRRGRILQISDTRIEDEGTYTCVARNNASAPRRHHMEITVVKIPIFVDAPQPVTVVRTGQYVTLTFSIESKPDPLMIWTYNGQPLFEDSSGVTLTTLYVDGEPTNGHMVMARAMKDDVGYYGCMAYNKYGEVYTETLLYVIPRNGNVTQLIKK